MPFDPAPTIIVNPWVIEHPKEAIALADLAAYTRRIPARQWDFEQVRSNCSTRSCGTIGCALGHAPFVPSCRKLGLRQDRWGDLYRDEGGCRTENSVHDVFNLPALVAHSIFYGKNNGSGYAGYPVRLSEVTREMVADRIEHWLATGEIR